MTPTEINEAGEFAAKVREFLGPRYRENPDMWEGIISRAWRGMVGPKPSGGFMALFHGRPRVTVLR